MAFYVPSIYVSVEEFSQARNMEFPKLNKGLGLNKMAIPDVGEDAATMAANALVKLFRQNDLSPSEVGRIYMGTESALDSAKPTASYALEMLEEYLRPTHGEGCLEHVDVVDMTFACIGAVDALQNTLDWVRCGEGRKGIVVASDNAKYELESPGEYTQGAGAVALLVQKDPSLLSMGHHWGVATKSVHDFFKPRREHSKKELLGNASESKHALWNNNEPVLEEFRETPVFDGQFSNECYAARINEAYARFKNVSETGLEQWSYEVFHLPYAFHGRRIFTQLYIDYVENESELETLEAELGLARSDKGFVRAMSKTEAYKQFVKNNIAPGEWASSDIGNMYTASIFMSLMSLLTHEEEGSSGRSIGFFAYGSGSKAKVFEGTVGDDIASKVKNWELKEGLEARVAIDFEEYQALHNGQLSAPLRATQSLFLRDSNKYEGDLPGQKQYRLI